MTRDEPVGLKAKRVLAIIREDSPQSLTDIRAMYLLTHHEDIAKSVVSKIHRWLTDEEKALLFPNREES